MTPNIEKNTYVGFTLILQQLLKGNNFLEQNDWKGSVKHSSVNYQQVSLFERVLHLLSIF